MARLVAAYEADLEPQRTCLDRDLADVSRRLQNVITSLEAIGPDEDLIARLRALKTKKVELQTQLNLLKQPAPSELLTPADLTAALDETDRLLTDSNISQARKILRSLVEIIWVSRKENIISGEIHYLGVRVKTPR